MYGDVSPEEHDAAKIITVSRCSCDELCDLPKTYLTLRVEATTMVQPPTGS